MQYFMIGWHVMIGFFTIATMVNVCIGEQKMNNILAELHISSTHQRTLKEREKHMEVHSKKLQVNHTIMHCWMKVFVQRGVTSTVLITRIAK